MIAEFADAAPIVCLETAAEGETVGLVGEWPAAMRRHDHTSASTRSPKDSVSPLPTTMADHWWQRPGRLPGRELYHWHMLFDDQPKVQELAAIAQQRLAGLPGASRRGHWVVARLILHTM